MVKILSMENTKFVVVWAKIRGFPWWPGLVTSIQVEITNSKHLKELPPDTVFTVRFLGENTQYLIFSSNLSSKFIHDFEMSFEKHSKTKNKVKKT